MKFAIYAVAGAALLAGAGCSLVAPSNQIVALNVAPVDTELIVGSMAYPGGAIFIDVPRNRELLITAKRKGYREQKMVVSYSLSSTGTIDACFSLFILPIFGLFSPGAWELDQNVINITLEPEPPVAAAFDPVADAVEAVEVVEAAPEAQPAAE